MGFFSDLAGGFSGLVTGGVPGLLSGINNSQQQSSANQINLDQAQVNRDFQERMSNSAYQRGMEDMRKAGLNPMLAFSQGGASTPSGSTGSVSPVKTDVPNALDKASTMMGMKSTAKAVEQSEAQTEKIRSDTGLNSGVAGIQQAQIKKINADASISSAEATRAQQEADFYKKNPEMIPIEKISGAASSALGVGADAGILLRLLGGAMGRGGKSLRPDQQKILKQYDNAKSRWDDADRKRRMP